MRCRLRARAALARQFVAGREHGERESHLVMGSAAAVVSYMSYAAR